MWSCLSLQTCKVGLLVGPASESYSEDQTRSPTEQCLEDRKQISRHLLIPVILSLVNLEAACSGFVFDKRGGIDLGSSCFLEPSFPSRFSSGPAYSGIQ